MSNTRQDLLLATEGWLLRESRVRSAVLFGSNARGGMAIAAPDAWSDIDLHVVTTAPAELEHLDWQKEFPSEKFCFHAVRPATGGVRKATVLFANGQLDLVLVPQWQMSLARATLKLRIYGRSRALLTALNEIATCLWSGYRFLKGESEWGRFYARVAAEMPGVRLSDDEIRARAAVSLCDLLWIFQKLERGELVAAQQMLHRSLAETNLMLLRELRLRRGEPLPSFGLGRRLEQLLSPEQLRWVSVSSLLDARSICEAAWHCLSGLQMLMRELTGERVVPKEMMHLLDPYRTGEPTRDG